ncbi:MAG: restriction endonuclease subunit S [Taibaiella sp.]|nr:restriction endonuclease subunit S [Taibaiella sp.]
MVERNFKHTEIGLIPEDWELVRIGDSFQFKNGLNKEKTFFGYGFPIVNYMDVFKYTFITSDIKGKVFLSKQELRNFEVTKGDVLFTRTSETQEEIGYSSVVVEELKDTVFSGFVLRARPFNNLFDIKFCGYVFSNRIVREQIISNATYTTRALTNGRVLSDVKIPLPPLPEQQAIAETLTHTDEWVESLEKLITKKRLIKQGAMQKLLTPNKAWKVRKLREVGKTYGGLSGKTKQDFGTGNAFYLPFLNIINNVTINENFIEKVNLKQGELQNRVLKNDLLFNGSSETPEELGISSVLLNDIENLYLNSFCFGFRIFDDETNSLFLSYLMRSPYGRNAIFFLAQGATRYNLSKSNFLELEISFPSIDEQIYVANILSDMDSEIEVLEQKLAKAKQIKEGMMQELLTGRIRLIESSNQSRNHKLKKAIVNM